CHLHTPHYTSFLHDSPPPPTSPSFPTRRSSDLDFPPKLLHGSAGSCASIARQPGRFDFEQAGLRGSRKLYCRRIAAGSQRQSGADRKSTRLNSSHLGISYAVFCLKKKSESSIST